eukprot:352084-Chlamydomonas_euryale.AAC.7
MERTHEGDAYVERSQTLRVDQTTGLALSQSERHCAVLSHPIPPHLANRDLRNGLSSCTRPIGELGMPTTPPNVNCPTSHLHTAELLSELGDNVRITMQQP